MTESPLAAVDALGLEAVGRSTLGRPILARAFGAGPGRPRLVVGGVHGDEPASVLALVDLAQALARREPAARPIWILPALNPDGLGAGTQNSARDVDLNRNFPARNFSTAHAPGHFPGAAPLSEPETAVLASLVAATNFEAVVAVHAPLACVNYDGPAAAWADVTSRACGWPVRAAIGYPTPGSLGSWLGVDRGLPVLTIELPPGDYAAFAPAARAALDTAVNAGRIG